MSETAEALEMAVDKIADLEEVLADMVQLVEDLSPGVRHIALRDYALFNEAPIRARKLLGES